MMTGGKLFIVSAPSGTGKTTILKKVVSLVRKLAFSVSHTTRSPRRTERDGHDYYFVNKEQFEEIIGAGGFLEWAEVHGNYYGTALTPLKKQLAEGNDVILDIDVQGAEIVRRSCLLPNVDIFIAPPDLHELEKRLRGRGTEGQNEIVRRLENARTEMRQCDHYEYLIVNDQVDSAVKMLTSILYAERSRERRTLHGDAVGHQ